MGFVSLKRGVCRSRKAMMHELYFTTFQLLMVILVTVGLLQFVNNVATDIGFEKRYLATDISLLTTAAFHVPGTLKYTYESIDIQTAVDGEFRESVFSVKERGDKPVVMKYWYLSDYDMYTMKGITPLHRIAPLKPREFTLYKTGQRISLNERDTNALQITCPTKKTADPKWKEKQNIFIGKAFATDKELQDQAHHVNRIATQLINKHPQLMSDKTKPVDETITPAAISSQIPQAHLDLAIFLGDSKKSNPPGLVVYTPINSKLLDSRKLACMIINELLTPDSSVLYAQIMPLPLSEIDENSPLNIFNHLAGEQIAVFLDIAQFQQSQVDIDNTANSIYRAVGAYYGEHYDTGQMGSTLKV